MSLIQPISAFPNYLDNPSRVSLLKFLDAFFRKEGLAINTAPIRDHLKLKDADIKHDLGDLINSLVQHALDPKARVPSGLFLRDDLKEIVGEKNFQTLIQHLINIAFNETPHNFSRELPFKILAQRKDLREIVGKQNLEKLVNKAIRSPMFDSAQILFQREDLKEIIGEEKFKELVSQAIQDDSRRILPCLVQRKDFRETVGEEKFKELLDKESYSFVKGLLQRGDFREIVGEEKFKEFVSPATPNHGLVRREDFRETVGEEKFKELVSQAIKDPNDGLAVALALGNNLDGLPQDQRVALKNSINYYIQHQPDRPNSREFITRHCREIFDDSNIDIVYALNKDNMVSALVSAALVSSEDIVEIAKDRFKDLVHAAIKTPDSHIAQLLAKNPSLGKFKDLTEMTDLSSKLFDNNFTSLEREVHISCGHWLNDIFSKILTPDQNTTELKTRFLAYCPKAMRTRIQVGLQCPIPREDSKSSLSTNSASA